MKRLLAALLLVLLWVGSAGASDSVVVQFVRIAHLNPRLETTLYCDGTLVGTEVIDEAPLAWITYTYEFTTPGCSEYSVEFAGTVWAGMGQKLDNVSLSVNGGPNLLINGDFSDRLNGWSNPDIGTNGTNGAWTWAVRPKSQAKLDIDGAGSNAIPGVTYRLIQVINN